MVSGVGSTGFDFRSVERNAQGVRSTGCTVESESDRVGAFREWSGLGESEVGGEANELGELHFGGV
jgi:hypothetical protein